MSDNLVDFHTHILPNMDDGSDSIETSLKMLNSAKIQGVTDICLTPHFYAEEEYPDEFLKRRDASFQKLSKELNIDINLKLGAEVAYFYGIGNSQEIKKLTINNSKYILVEMPYCEHWDKKMLDDVLNIQKKQGLSVILAHVHRYMGYGFKRYYEMLHDNGVLFQWNSEAFLSDIQKESIKFFDKGFVDILGSDAHNLTTRQENLKEAVDILTKWDKIIFEKIITKSEDILR